MTFTSIIVLKEGLFGSLQTFVNEYDEECPGQGTIDAELEFEEAVMQIKEDATSQEMDEYIGRGGYSDGVWDIRIVHHSPVGIQ